MQDAGACPGYLCGASLPARAQAPSFVRNACHANFSDGAVPASSGAATGHYASNRHFYGKATLYGELYNRAELPFAILFVKEKSMEIRDIPLSAIDSVGSQHAQGPAGRLGRLGS